MSHTEKLLNASKVRSEIMKNGVYPDWLDTMKMQNQFIDNEVKGWKVAVRGGCAKVIDISKFR